MENLNQSPDFKNIPPDNNLVWAILSTALCCLPTGIYAIIKATEVNTKWVMGDFDGARKSAEEALKWSLYGALALPIIILLYFFSNIFILTLAILASLFEV